MLFQWELQGTPQTAAILANANEFIASVLLMPIKSADLSCHVAELADAYEVILGVDWLKKYSVTQSLCTQMLRA